MSRYRHKFLIKNIMKIFDGWLYMVIYVYDNNIWKVRKNLRENLNIETVETQLVFTGSILVLRNYISENYAGIANEWLKI